MAHQAAIPPLALLNRLISPRHPPPSAQSIQSIQSISSIPPPQAPPAAGLLQGIPGTAFAASDESAIPPGAQVVRLPSHEEILEQPFRLVEASLAEEHRIQEGSKWAVQASNNRLVIFAPPAQPLPTPNLDALHALPFRRASHPSYKQPIPALEMIQFSITAHRGCASGCSFCTLALHQGRRMASRSEESVVDEVRELTRHPDWKGSVSDIGGPTANLWGASCQTDPARCQRESCLVPGICPHFKTDQEGYLNMLRRAARVPGVKHVRSASGIRHDLALDDPPFARAFIREFIGGQVKIAPEHLCDSVLSLMRKPKFPAFERFLALLEKESGRAGKRQYIVPYLMSAFPGCTDEDMKKLADWLRARGWNPQQVQCFIPLPGTVAGQCSTRKRTRRAAQSTSRNPMRSAFANITFCWAAKAARQIANKIFHRGDQKIQYFTQ